MSYLAFVSHDPDNVNQNYHLNLYNH
jgi:hypothetical protein